MVPRGPLKPSVVGSYSAQGIWGATGKLIGTVADRQSLAAKTTACGNDSRAAWTKYSGIAVAAFIIWLCLLPKNRRGLRKTDTAVDQAITDDKPWLMAPSRLTARLRLAQHDCETAPAKAEAL